MRNRRRRGWLLAALMVATPACASVQERITATENRMAALEAQVADLQAAQQNVITRLTQIRQDLEGSLDPMRTAQADRGEDVRILQTQVNALRQQMSLLQERLDEVLQQMSAPAAGSPAAPMPPAGERGRQAAGQPGARAVGNEADVLFDNAFSDYMSGEFVLAVDGFRELLARFPDSGRADEALYWMAESLAAQDDHAGARQRFLELVAVHEDSLMLPDAKLRAALEAIELGERQAAVAELRELIAAHPGTDQVLIACMQLRQLGERLPAACPSPPGTLQRDPERLNAPGYRADTAAPCRRCSRRHGGRMAGKVPLAAVSSAWEQSGASAARLPSLRLLSSARGASEASRGPRRARSRASRAPYRRLGREKRTWPRESTRSS